MLSLPSTNTELNSNLPAPPPVPPLNSDKLNLIGQLTISDAIRNRYDALTRLNGEENLASDAEKKKSEVDKRQNKSTENANHKQRPTPLERLMRMKIRSEATSLLIGDSVTQYVDEKRVSVGGAVVQNMSVQAGDGNSKDPPTPQIPCRL
nr:hypothetical protein BaRGS_004486 [Batillaria attramentaria]